jgi:ubiquinone/menaquinone biosynthesis C-methylase UbiE
VPAAYAAAPIPEQPLSDSNDYPLGYSEQEARRLAAQGALLEEYTAELLRRAGLRPGMHVLDVGCGVGDVSLLAARMVGLEGSVVGIDRAASSIDTARRRAASAGAKNVEFMEADIASFETDRLFDALTGRLVLLYVPNPGTALRRLCRYLNPGALVAFQEYDIPQFSQSPPSDFFERIRSYILEAFAAGGAELNMGTKLYSTFVRAGLPPPQMISGSPVGCGTHWPGYEYMVGVVRSLLPLMERAGIATPQEIGIDTLAERLRNDSTANERLGFLPRIVGAWTRIAE